PSASPFSLGAAASFGVLGLPSALISASNATVTGEVGVSSGGQFLSGNNTVTGTITEASVGQVLSSGRSGSVSINPARLAQADSDSLNASSQAASLAPTQTLGTVKAATIVTGNGGLNVIDINGDIGNTLALNGTANDVFIVNVTGTLNLSGKQTLDLGGGVTANHVLYNFTGAGNTLSVK